MPLIKSIAGIRGTIGGSVGQGLSPIDIVQITASFGQYVLGYAHDPSIIVGKDARQSGFMISQLVSATLQSLGINVIDLGLTTTPTLALAIPQLQAQGGIMISASHNPGQWNALKLLNQAGEFIDALIAKHIFTLAEQGNFSFAEADYLGRHTLYPGNYIDQHIKQILALPLVDVAAIAKRKFKIVVDGINSVGGIAIPKLLAALRVSITKLLYAEPTGIFQHDPEPLPEHLGDLAKTVQQGDYDVGIAVDPDVDRLAIIDEQGQAWGEDYTLVAAADYVLSQTPGNTVSTLSSSSVLQTITQQYGGTYIASPVGEMHVVHAMKVHKAVIGGEGNGGVIYPALHYNRDALVGIALLLTHLARSGKKASELRASYPNAVMLKRKIDLDLKANTALIFEKLKNYYKQYPIDMQEGLKVYLDRGWVHIRKSNTEPVLRLYVEGDKLQVAEATMQEACHMLESFYLA